MQNVHRTPPPQLSWKWQISNSKYLLLLIYCKSDTSITFSAHVCSWQPDIGKTFFLIQFHEDFRAHGFWVAVAAPGILNNVRFSLEVHHSCNTQLMLQLDGHVLQLPRATSQPDVGQNPSIEKTLQRDCLQYLKETAKFSSVPVANLLDTITQTLLSTDFPCQAVRNFLFQYNLFCYSWVGDVWCWGSSS